jgi:uncharacterized protein
MQILERACEAADHQFWPLDEPLSDLHPEIRRRLMGQKQLTDAILLNLAIRHGGQFVTLDQGVRRLLPLDSELQASIVVLTEV